MDRELEIIERTPDGIVLLTLDQLKFVLGAVMSMSLSIVILVLVSLTIPTVPAMKPPVELLFLIPFPVIFTLVFLREATKKGLLLKRFKRKRNHNKA